MKKRLAVLGLTLAIHLTIIAACQSETAPSSMPDDTTTLLQSSSTLTPTTQSPGETTLEILIPSTTLGWKSSGIWLQAGDSYALEAAGEVNIWPNCEETKVDAGFTNLDCGLVPTGPEGTTAFDPADENEGYPYPGGPIAALTVRVGEGEAILVGTGGTFTADATGFLQFAINDVTSVWDNTGEFTVDATVHFITSPAITKGSWSDTGIVLDAGEEFTITASGTINMWPNCEETKEEQGFPGFDCSLTSAVSPVGTDAFAPGLDDYPLPGENTLALVARVSNGPVFLVGESGTFITEAGGPLLLTTNDTGYWKQDDQGTFVIIISRESTGDGIYVPGTYDDWLDTGFFVEAGETVTITASGILDVWPRCEIEKEGAGVPEIDCDQMRMEPGGSTGVNPPPEDHPPPPCPMRQPVH